VSETLTFDHRAWIVPGLAPCPKRGGKILFANEFEGLSCEDRSNRRGDQVDGIVGASGGSAGWISGAGGCPMSSNSSGTFGNLQAYLNLAPNSNPNVMLATSPIDKIGGIVL
jgi:hypothetical protein